MANQYVWIYYYLTYTDQTAYAAALALNGGQQQIQVAPASAAGLFPSATLTCPWPYAISGSLSDSATTVSLLGPNQPNGPPTGQVGYDPATIRAGDAQTSVTVNWYDYPYDGAPHPQTQVYAWVGVLTLAQAASAPAPPTVTQPPPAHATPYVGPRRWVEGFEVPPGGSGATGSVAFDVSRDASRTAEGFGFAYRGLAPTSAVTHATPSPHPVESWERFYVRVRTLPAAEQNLWAVLGSVQAGAAIVLTVDSGGVARIYNQGNAAYPGTLMLTAQSAWVVGTWYRVDAHFRFYDGATGGYFEWFLNGTQDGVRVAASGGQGLAVNQLHASSQFGAVGGTNQGLEADLDDWISADPITVNGTATPGVDLNSGSHVVCIRPTGLAADSSVNWAGDWRELLSNPVSGALATAGMSSSTASAKLAVTTDYTDQQIGCAAFTVGVLSASTSTVTAQLGYTINGVETLVSLTVAQNAWETALYTIGAATAEPLPLLKTLHLVYVKDSGAGGQYINALLASAELLGQWGACDVPPGGTYLGVVNPGIQNAPYPSLSGALQPSGEVVVSQGLYTGNNVGQDIAQRYAAHWVWIRPLSGTVTDGVAWDPAQTTAHGWTATGPSADRLPQAQLTPGSSPVFRTAGPAAAANANSVSYQYVAVSDPSGRFLRLKAFAHAASVASAVNALADAGFTPQAAFLTVEAPTGSTSQRYYKGVGHTTDTASLLTAAVSSGVATFGAGTITSLTPLHTANPQTAVSAWRATDNNGTTGLVALVTYTGTGTSSLNVALATLNGNVPVFVLVVPHNGASYFRDPSHTGTNSETITGSNTTTGITAVAANQITVGTTLNSVGVVYDVFALGGNPAGVSLPVPPQPGPSGGYPPAPTPNTPLGAGCVSLGTAINELAARLTDTTGVHWTAAELRRYLLEAIRAYNAVTRVYRGQGSFSTVALQTFYDLPTVLPTLLGNTLLDQDLVTDLEYSLIEPPTPSAWTGTAQFTLAMLTQAIQRRRDQFLRETGMQLTEQTQAVTIDATGRVSLPQNVVTVRRAAWIMASGAVVPMFRDDEWALAAFFPTWNQTPTDPTVNGALSFSLGVAPPLTAQLAPPPLANGTLDVVAVVLGATLNPTTGVLLGVPDDFAWVVKWGALADLLGQAGTAQDLARAAVAEQLWQLGVDTASKAPVVLASRISGVSTQLDTLQDADRFDPSWQTTPNTPAEVLVASGNLVALNPPPDANGPYTVTLDVVRNLSGVIPATLSDCYFEGGVAVLEALYSYAQFVALFKEGALQAQQAAPLLTRFLSAVGITQALDQASVPDRQPLFAQTRNDERALPRVVPPETDA